jgi:hypothetical protein
MRAGLNGKLQGATSQRCMHKPYWYGMYGQALMMAITKKVSMSIPQENNLPQSKSPHHQDVAQQ